METSIKSATTHLVALVAMFSIVAFSFSAVAVKGKEVVEYCEQQICREEIYSNRGVLREVRIYYSPEALEEGEEKLLIRQEKYKGKNDDKYLVEEREFINHENGKAYLSRKARYDRDGNLRDLRWYQRTPKDPLITNTFGFVEQANLFAEPGDKKPVKVFEYRIPDGKILRVKSFNNRGVLQEVREYDEDGNVSVEFVKGSSVITFHPEGAEQGAPQTGFFEDYFHAVNNQINQTIQDKITAGEPIRLMLFGDSITDALDNSSEYLEVWNTYYAGYGAVNAGIGADRSTQLLWRLNNGHLEGVDPDLVVINIGSNDIFSTSPAMTPESTTREIERILVKIRTILPNAQILLHGPLPRGLNPTDAERLYNKSVREMIKPFDQEPSITYRSFGDIFLLPNGQINTQLVPDHTHPNPQGQEMLAELLVPFFEQYISG